MLVIDETGFLKQGAKRHAEWRGNTLRSAGKITNCQIGVFAAYVSRHGQRSSIARCIFRRNGPRIQIVWKPHMCLPVSALRPSQSLQRA